MRAQHTQAVSNKRAITSETLVNQAQNKLVNIRSTKNAPHVVMQRVDFLSSRKSFVCEETRGNSYAWLAACLPSAACAAARRAIGTRYGEHDT